MQFKFVFLSQYNKPEDSPHKETSTYYIQAGFVFRYRYSALKDIGWYSTKKVFPGFASKIVEVANW